MHQVVTYIKEMLEERGYDIKKDLEPTFENGPFFKREDGKENIKIYMAKYMAKEKLGVNNFDIPKKEAKKISEEILKYIVINTQPKTKIIVVFPQELLEKFSPEKILSLPVLSPKIQISNSNKITIFSETDFKFNPTKNILVPKHELAPEEDKKILKSKRIRKMDLPKISPKDAICRWYGFEEGQIVKISEEGRVYYRCVSDSEE
jgi:DNA-directed RNA polymerase subunit H (RpoH/RPB5)